MTINSKQGAMEMSVGTIVTIVLLMSVLVLGIFLVQRIFASGTNAIDTIDSQVQSEIEKLFADEWKKIVIYPTAREIKIKNGDDPKGFAFSVRNDADAGGPTDFSYTISASSGDLTRCGSGFTQERANSYLIGSSGTFTVPLRSKMDMPILVRFDVPESAPPCTIFYEIRVKRNNVDYTSGSVMVTIK